MQNLTWNCATTVGGCLSPPLLVTSVMPPDIVLLTSKPDRTFEGLWKDKQQPTEIINFNAQAPRNVVKQITWSNLKKNVVKLHFYNELFARTFVGFQLAYVSFERFNFCYFISFWFFSKFFWKLFSLVISFLIVWKFYIQNFVVLIEGSTH